MKARTVGLALAVLMAGCTVGPNYRRPVIPTPQSWKELPASGVALGERGALARWWMTFRDPTLEALVARAVEENLDLKIAAARVLEARAEHGIAASRALPQVDASAAYSRAERSDAIPPFNSAAGAPSPFGPRDQNLFQAGFDASWEIDVFGGVRRAKEAALAQVQASQESQRDVLVTVVAEVARNYVELRGAQRRLEILDATLVSQRDSRDLAQARFDAGLGSELDVTRADGLLDTIESQRPELERLARQSFEALRVLIGGDLGALTPALDTQRPIPPLPPQIPSVLPSELLSRRPDLRSAERELAAATARIGEATADLFPRFSITGSFGRLSEDYGNLGLGSAQFWTFLSTVRWPIFAGGRLLANVRVQEARRDQAYLQYRKALLVAVEEVENALSTHVRERRREADLGSAVQANQRSLELATERYTGGVESFLSVLDAQRSLYAAQDLQVQSESSAATSLIALYKALGGGWEKDAGSSGPSARGALPPVASRSSERGSAR
jgi:NodT family efflux transporter outer membrane factor (OMF) lipoprotein